MTKTVEMNKCMSCYDWTSNKPEYGLTHIEIYCDKCLNDFDLKISVSELEIAIIKLTGNNLPVSPEIKQILQNCVSKLQTFLLKEEKKETDK